MYNKNRNDLFMRVTELNLQSDIVSSTPKREAWHDLFTKYSSYSQLSIAGIFIVKVLCSTMVSESLLYMVAEAFFEK